MMHKTAIRAGVAGESRRSRGRGEEGGGRGGESQEGRERKHEETRRQEDWMRREVEGICEGRPDISGSLLKGLTTTEDPEPARRVRAMQDLKARAPIGQPMVVSKAIIHLQDSDLHVRLAALDLLVHVARRGDRTVIQAIVAQLNGHCRKDPTNPGDASYPHPKVHGLHYRSMRPVEPSFKHSPELRIAGIQALAAIAEENDLRTTICIADIAGNETDEKVRRAAINALVSFSKFELVRDIEAKVRQMKHKQTT